MTCSAQSLAEAINSTSSARSALGSGSPRARALDGLRLHVPRRIDPQESFRRIAHDVGVERSRGDGARPEPDRVRCRRAARASAPRATRDSPGLLEQRAGAPGSPGRRHRPSGSPGCARPPPRETRGTARRPARRSRGPEGRRPAPREPAAIEGGRPPRCRRPRSVRHPRRSCGSRARRRSAARDRATTTPARRPAAARPVSSASQGRARLYENQPTPTGTPAGTPAPVDDQRRRAAAHAASTSASDRPRTTSRGQAATTSAASRSVPCVCHEDMSAGDDSQIGSGPAAARRAASSGGRAATCRTITAPAGASNARPR